MLTPKVEKKLFLLDAFALIYRAYYAFIKNPRTNTKGENTSAAFGFTNALLDIIKKEEPTHLAVVFDGPSGAANRIQEYKEYKAHREAMPEDIRNMIEPIKRIIRGFNIPILMNDGFEADDVIGTLAKIAETKGFTTYMMTPDKDFGQLVTEKTMMYRPGRGRKPAEIWDVAKVKEKFNVDDPIQVIDVLGMWGDAADNIPGIPGIGEKTSKELIKKYGSMETVFNHIDDFKGKRKENLITYQQQGILSKKLATIITDVAVPFDADALKICEPNYEQLKAIFTILEFRSIARRVLGEELVLENSSILEGDQLDMFSAIQTTSPSEGGQQSLDTEKVNYQMVQTEAERKKLLSQLMEQKSVCFDIETDGLEPRHVGIVGISFSFKEKQAFYLPFPLEFPSAQKILEEFKPFFESERIEKVAHNIKYDEQVINRYGIALKGGRFDTMIAHYLLQPDGKHNMDILAELYLNYKPVPIETLIGKKGKSQRSMRDIAQEEIVNYACEDADITWQLKMIFEPKMQEKHLKRLFYDIEMPLTEVLKAMEQEGIQLDVERLQTFSKTLEEDLLRIEMEVKTLSEEDFNLDSPKQLGEVLFEKMQITSKPKKTKTGQYSTSEDTLMKHYHDHKIIPLVLEYRSLRKLKNTYVDPLPTMVDKEDGRLHTHFMQTVAATGRLSSTQPNLQNIPVRTTRGKEMRKAFVAKNDDYYLMAADYSQIELRIIAALSGDKQMIQAFLNKQDVHAATAAKVFEVPLEEVTRDQRSSAKAVNFGIIYGQSAFGLSQTLGIKRKDAKAIIDSYYAQFPTLKVFMQATKEEAKTKGYVETIMQRRRYLPDINSKNAIVRGFAERNAVNAPIQGSAADIIKIAMINIYRKFKNLKLTSRMLLQVHDELLFDVIKKEQAVVEKIVREEMEGAVQLVVPLEIEMKFAQNWLAAH